jgi:hypothetical protein
MSGISNNFLTDVLYKAIPSLILGSYDILC